MNNPDVLPDTTPERQMQDTATPDHPELEWQKLDSRRRTDHIVQIAHHRMFQELGPGLVEPGQGVLEPKTTMGRALMRVKRAIVGEPIPIQHEIHERLTKIKALAVLSSDALSSEAYGTEAIMRVLVLAGAGALSLTMPISLVIVALMAIVVTSYQQTIRAYPSGGGSYIVARENLGTLPGLVAGASLLIDYVLTVAVSIAAGVAAILSAFPELRDYSIEVAIGSVILIAVLNLRGIRESGTVFAAPTYIFVFAIFGVIAMGIFRLATGGIAYTPGDPGAHAGTEPLTLFLLLSAFSKGCAALTGTEAISNGVPAFKPPEARNAGITLISMAVLLGGMFLGTSFLATQIGIVPDPSEQETVLSQITRLVVGENWYYYLVQLSTALILVLAANTSYADFPRLLSIIARDRFAPRWFASRGDRLAFSFGIGALTILSVALLAIFQSNVERLLPLYAIGVFTSFTLSQSGMVVHWLRLKGSGWRRSIVINALGAAATAVVALVIGATKFAEGAWMVILLAPAIVALFLVIHRHYLSVARQLSTKELVRPTGIPPLVLVPVYSLSLVARRALAFAQDLSSQVMAVHVASSVREAERLRGQWREAVGDIPLVIIISPNQFSIEPLLTYVDALLEAEEHHSLFVILPEFVVNHWWEHLLHNQTALRLKAALLFRPGVVVASFPFLLGS
jgi:amino acid transporter